MLGFGGQTALNCGVKLDEQGILEKYGIKVLGTQISGIKSTEDRQLFKDSMNQCGVPMLKSKTVYSFEDAKKVASELGYPVIVRVAYTLGGKGGGVAFNEIELYEIVGRGLSASMVGQILIEEYVGSWKQIEYEVMQDYFSKNDSRIAKPNPIKNCPIIKDQLSKFFCVLGFFCSNCDPRQVILITDLSFMKFDRKKILKKLERLKVFAPLVIGSNHFR